MWSSINFEILLNDSKTTIAGVDDCLACRPGTICETDDQAGTQTESNCPAGEVSLFLAGSIMNAFHTDHVRITETIDILMYLFVASVQKNLHSKFSCRRLKGDDITTIQSVVFWTDVNFKLIILRSELFRLW